MDFIFSNTFCLLLSSFIIIKKFFNFPFPKRISYTIIYFLIILITLLWKKICYYSLRFHVCGMQADINKKLIITHFKRYCFCLADSYTLHTKLIFCLGSCASSSMYYFRRLLRSVLKNVFSFLVIKHNISIHICLQINIFIYIFLIYWRYICWLFDQFLWISQFSLFYDLRISGGWVDFWYHLL